jgi:hypothetical protein
MDKSGPDIGMTVKTPLEKNATSKLGTDFLQSTLCASGLIDRWARVAILMSQTFFSGLVGPCISRLSVLINKQACGVLIVLVGCRIQDGLTNI